MSEYKFGTIDLKRASEMVAKAIADKPEGYVFTDKCINTLFDFNQADYSSEGLEGKSNIRPGCLVGTVVVEMLDDVEWFLRGRINGSAAHDTLRALKAQGLADYTLATWDYLSYLQTEQDCRKTWVEADERAMRDVLRRYVNDLAPLTDEESEFLFSVFGSPRPKEEYKAEKAARKAAYNKATEKHDALAAEFDKAYWEKCEASDRYYAI